MSETPYRESFAPKIPPGTRVRAESGKWETRGSGHDARWYLVEGWLALEWALVQTGTTISDIDAQGGIDWNAKGCGAWAVPDFATGVIWDGDTLPSWHRSSLLDVIGYAQADPKQLEMFT